MAFNQNRAQQQLYAHFALLMEAPSKDLIQSIFTHGYMHRADMTQINVTKYTKQFGKPEKVTESMVQQVRVSLLVRFLTSHTKSYSQQSAIRGRKGSSFARIVY
jgi:hypothetical protein